MLHEVKLVCDVCILAADQVLLVRYSDTNKYDHQAGLFLPDDYLLALEHPEDAALRILQEQLGISQSVVLQEDVLQLDHIESFKGGDKSWHLIFHFALRMGAKPLLTLNPNIAEARWFDLGALPPREEVAHHGWALGVIRQIVGGPPLAQSA
jgi:ADP-ribose pyrophosphatase YjhB (NUDIX family)